MKEKYISTRGGEKNRTASQAIVAGIGEDGGLFVPSFLADLHLDLSDLQDLSYGELAKKVFGLFLDDFSDEDISRCVDSAYYSGKFTGDEPVAVKKAGDRYFLELYHGPTAAFKDMALTILPYLMTTAMANIDIDKDILILTATSGDTGKAALEGFAEVPRIDIIVYYPKDGVSPIQEKQMLTQVGDNTMVVGVHGNFDDTQSGVKAIMGDPEIKAYLDERGFNFSSANSINIGRLLPQIIYYFYSYNELVKKGEIELGDAVNFVVPTGNFGNILAGYYAHLLGLPVNRFICASNQNNILTDFFATGSYDRNREFYKTTSPSMDILISSNLERLLFDLTDNNAEVIAGLMTDLNEKGVYNLPAEYFNAAKRQKFYAGYADEDKVAASMKAFYENEGYLMDPHTAVAGAVYDDYVAATGDKTPTIILSTASPYKFATSVYTDLFGPLPEGMNDYGVLAALAEKTGTTIPAPLKDLDKKDNRHNTVVDKKDMSACVKSIIDRR